MAKTTTKTAPAKGAKPATKPAKAVKAKHKVGDLLMFTGYEDLDDDQDPIFEGEQAVRVIEVVDSEKIRVESVAVNEDTEEKDADTVFTSELRELTADEREEAETIIAQQDEADSDEDEDEEDESDSEEDEDEEDEEESDEDEDEEDESDSEEDEEDEEESDDEDEDESDSEDDDEESDAEETLGAKADAGDKAAGKELTKQAKAAGIDPNDYETWVEVEELLADIAKKAAKKAAKGDAPATKKAASSKRAKPVADEADAEDEEKKFISVASVKKELKDHGNNAVQAAVDLVHRADKSYFDLGGVLQFIYSTDGHTALTHTAASVKKLKADAKAAGEEAPDVKVGDPIYPDSKQGFRAFVEDHLNIGWRHAYWLMSIYRKFSAMNKTAEDFCKIGWSKAKELCAESVTVTEDNFDEVIEYAEKHGREDLVSYLSEKYSVEEGGEGGSKGKGGSKGEQAERVAARFRLFEDQKSLLDTSLNAARQVLEIPEDDKNGDAAALVHIVTEWATLNDQDITLKQAVKALEARFKVKVTTEKVKAETEKPAAKGKK